MENLKKILIIGSGPIKIAEAAEFDYSTSQALKALKEENISSVLINSNIATVQTSHSLADRVYLLPVTPYFVQKVIEKERPDGILVGFGGQTALNIGIDLYNSGFLDKYSVKVLGTPIRGIERALSREKFRETMIEAKIPVPPSFSARSVEEALKRAEEVGYPVMVRVSFNLGGRGSTVAWTPEELKRDMSRALSQSYIGEVLVEKYLKFWKELEYEVIKDKDGNSTVVACIENLDPMGVHTGESVVVAPCQTLDNHEYQIMRSTAIKVAESIELVGECNVQFALDPVGKTYFAIETNPRMSRSSALASKATGYPLAYVSAKLALGYRLYEIKNKVSGATCACFEPSLDYVVIKSPRWDLDKFEEVEDKLGTEMKSVGEVMSIGRTLEEALQKSARMLDIRVTGVIDSDIVAGNNKESALSKLRSRKPYWFLYAAAAFYHGATMDEVYEASGVDRFFLYKIKEISEAGKEIAHNKEKAIEKLPYLKKKGFSDSQIAKFAGITENEVYELRHKIGLLPRIKQIDTLAGEWPAVTNYLYLTYQASEDDVEFSSGNKLMLIGPGGFRIGVSVEFDWSLVSALNATRSNFDEVSVFNYNPETVSTDWDISRSLYFDEISLENVREIYERQNFRYVATFAGGQIGNTISKVLHENNIRIYGSSAESVDRAEDRRKFSELLNRLGIKQPQWYSAVNFEDLKRGALEIGYPILVRPSYVLSGSAMAIANNEEELLNFVKRASSISPAKPVVISKYLSDAIEAEIDAASDGKSVVGVITEHVEEAGVHSGDATLTVPTRLLDKRVNEKMKEIVLTLSNELSIKGPFNTQFVVKDGQPFVIELNLRASRSMPFTSKAVGSNIIELGVKGINENYEWNGFQELTPKAWAVKSPQFSWTQIKGAYPYLGPEMRSTGEAASFGFSFHDALLKSWLGASPNRIPKSTVLVYGKSNLSYLKATASNLSSLGYEVVSIDQASYGSGAEVVSVEEAERRIYQKKVDMVVTDGYIKHLDYGVRRAAVDMNVPTVLNGRLALALSESFKLKDEMSVEEASVYGDSI